MTNRKGTSHRLLVLFPAHNLIFKIWIQEELSQLELRTLVNMKNLKCSHGMKNKNTAKKQQFSENCRRTLQRRQTFHRIYNYKLKLKHFFYTQFLRIQQHLVIPALSMLWSVCVCVCVCVCARARGRTVAQSCPILCNPTDWTPPGSSVHGIVQAWILEQAAISSSRVSSQPRNQTHISCITGRFFTTVPPGKPVMEVIPNFYIMRKKNPKINRNTGT